MNDDASEVRRLLGSLRDRPVSVDQERLFARRARVVSVLKRDVRTLAKARVSRAWRRAGYVALSLVAAAGVLLGVHRAAKQGSRQRALTITIVHSVGQTTAHAGVTPRALREGEALRQDAGEIESAANGSAELLTSAGLGLKMGGGTRVSLARLLAVNELELRQGLLTCSVPHLSEGERFSVQTPDARVVVHGTVFTVRVDSKRARGAETCVEVTDGVVIVQHQGGETALNAGDQWGCDVSPSAPMSESPVPAAPSVGARERHAAPQGSARPAERGTLGEESRLLQEALAAERVGQPERAQGLLSQLLARYPNSALASEARRASSRIATAAAGK
jgi:ferric-dicitrate binding protein FerR (iron transport regulator)